MRMDSGARSALFKRPFERLFERPFERLFERLFERPFECLFACLFACMAVACAPASKGLPATALPDAGASAESAPPIRFQFIYVVHGDAGYTWYDNTGSRHSADLEALDQAARVARQSPAAEVFVFHQKPKRFLGIFPGPDGALSVYRHGRLLLTRNYDRPEGENPLAAEARLFHALSAGPRGRTGTGRVEARVFAYFGHEIPASPGQVYSRSRSDTDFAMESFAAGLGLFGTQDGSEGKTFELVILSACHGGTPGATRALAPYASWLLAAPGELHLSYLETRALSEMADAGAPPLQAGEIGTRGRIIASESFERQKGSTVTEITLALYDTERAAAWLEAHPAWTDGSSGRERGTAGGTAVYRDCGNDPAFGAGGEDAGVLIFHQAPRFGRDKHKVFRSGWECRVTAKAE
jgi:hypothetical protein